MDFSENLVLKENFTFLVADRQGMVAGGERGLYNRDTRFLSRYRWGLDRGAQLLLAHTARPDRLRTHHAVIEGPSQLLGVTRVLTLGATVLEDAVEVENTSQERQELTLTLEFGADFADLFEARGWFEADRTTTAAVDSGTARLGYVAEDGLELAVALHFGRPATTAGASASLALEEGHATFRLVLEPAARATATVRIEIDNPLETSLPGIPYERWSADLPPTLPGGLPDERHQRALERAVEDLRALLLFTPEGPLPAAGIPWFVTPFGRDSLLTAAMMLPHYPEVARGTLRHLAAHQGREHDEYRVEAPGKILHEVRQGELARTGRIPFGRYYGTIDATPLFVVLLHHTWRATNDGGLVRELRPAWEAALGWMRTDGDPDGDGFLEFRGADEGVGLRVQSWKDSFDSLSHADGTLARGAIAVSEVQGYAYAAWRAAAEFYHLLGEPARAAECEARAQELQRRFQEAFWLEGLGTYALALDGDKRPLEVLSSDAGQLLWSGIVPEETAPRLVRTLMSDALWSGWGIRTLGAGEARYNPVSYHNGSVWPHDTALIASGLARYGFTREAELLRAALFDLAASQPDQRPPELITGYPRTDTPPVPYPVACRPQAWSAAALLYLAQLPG